MNKKCPDCKKIMEENSTYWECRDCRYVIIKSG